MIHAHLLERSHLRWILIGLFIVLSWFFASAIHAAGWISQTADTDGFSLQGQDFYSATVGLAVGGSKIVKTSNSGVTWTQVTSGTSQTLYDVQYITELTAIAVGDNGTVLRTTDGGFLWTVISTPITNGLKGVDMASTTIGVAVGTSGKILRTTDSGLTWTSISSGTTATLYGVAFATSSIGYVVGSSGTVLKTTDGGSTWSTLTSGVTNTFLSVYAVPSSSTVWATGTSGTLRKSTDSGANWSSVTVTGVTQYIYDIDFAGSTGLIATAAGGSTSLLYRTTDSGANWSAETFIDAQASSYYDVDLYNSTERSAVGYAGGVSRYDGSYPSAPTEFTSTDEDNELNDPTPTLTWSASTDAHSDLINYEISIDSGAYASIGTGTSYTWPTALADGTHSFSLKARDHAGNPSLTSVSLSITIDTIAPTPGTPSPTTAIAGTPTTFTSLILGSMVSCGEYLDGVYLGTLSWGEDGLWTYTYTFATSGTYALVTTCTDYAGNVGSSAAASVVVAGPPDTTAPSVGSLTPTTATADSTVTLSASTTDAVGVSSCSLYIGGVLQGAMTVSGTSASVAYNFSAAGTYSAYASCRDAAGNTTAGATTSITISAAVVETEDDATDTGDTTTDTEADTSPATDEEVSNTSGEASPGDLVKLACPAAPDVNDPCKAVYFYATDGKRHAFPHEKVYFTWYTDFDDVMIVSAEFLASLPLGKNVTYHPGTRMVKFITMPTVFTVSRGGVLRPIASEDVAQSLYGENWNQHIDDISDTFFGNYTFGADVEVSADYDVDEEETGTDSINTNL